MGDEKTVCKDPCEDWNCPYHPIKMDPRGSEYVLECVRGTEKCKNFKGGLVGEGNQD